ncbi:Vacuolar protein sorting-associated protein 8 homolog [Eumeta japonica]|uniref:Vacuolar protein sorting-associated protein 8 homolog n=1 Tax=Eumeta variegata TaxID=151549 RepID=A0A4C1SXB4_EUMVA|nr:Vacuolar protein sorting-associated protein 8 homolog [Eumeta japonica]
MALAADSGGSVWSLNFTHTLGVRGCSTRCLFSGARGEVKNQRWQEACDLALDGYKSAGDRPKRLLQAKERIIMLFKEYIAASARTPDYCLGAIIKCLITIGELELLWTQLWERLQNKELFLHHITAYIESDDIHHVNPVISQALVEYWLKISPSQLEEIILKMDWTCLDLNQWSEIGCLLNFIAQQISQSCLPADTQLLEKVLNYLSKESIENESARLHSERENAWHELLVNNCLDAITNDEDN